MNAKELIEAYVDDVVRRLRRRQRNDVGVELRALLGEELQTQEEIAGRPADEDMALDLLRRFGRPADVAARYLPPGFAVIEAADGPRFVRITAIGMALVWILGLVATFKDGGGLVELGRWWGSWGLGAFWWPGFLVVMWGIATWIRRRFPVADDWKPRAIDRDRISRAGWVLAIAFFALGIVWLTSPSLILEKVTGGRLAPDLYRALVYDEAFRQVRLPLLLTLLVAHVALYGLLVARGRWQRLTRRIDLALTAAVTGVLIWSVLAGPIFQPGPADQTARGAFVLVILFAFIAVVVSLRRELARVRMPASPSK